MTTDPNRPAWHAAETDLADYLAGDASQPTAASVETHLLGCERCRDVVARLAGETAREQAWDRLAEAIDHPSPGLLGRLTHGHWIARSAIATPLMVRAALAAVVLVGLVPLLAGLLVGDAGLVTLLVLAPLAPVAAVALAYRDTTDPAGEMGLATAAAGVRLVAARALAVSLVALPLAVLTSLAVDAWLEAVPLRLALAWCLPGLALAAVVLLAGTTRLDPLQVALGLGGGWAVLVLTTVTVRRSLRPEVLVDAMASPAAQATALAVALAALALTVVRRDAVAYRRTA